MIDIVVLVAAFLALMVGEWLFGGEYQPATADIHGRPHDARMAEDHEI